MRVEKLSENVFKTKERRANGEFVRGVIVSRWRMTYWACNRASRWTQHFPIKQLSTIPKVPTYGNFSLTALHHLQVNACPNVLIQQGLAKASALRPTSTVQRGSQEQSVPILHEKETKRIVCNESAEIIRVLDLQAHVLGNLDASCRRLFPDDPTTQNHITVLNDQIYVDINNGAYKAKFLFNQTAYKDASNVYFRALDFLNGLLSDGRPFLERRLASWSFHYPEAYNHADLASNKNTPNAHLKP